MRLACLVVIGLTGCTFYISGQPGDASGSGSGSSPDAFMGPEIIFDAPDPDAINPPLGDAAVDSLFPPFDAFSLDGLIPPFDAFVPPDIVIPPFDAFVPPDIIIPLPDAPPPMDAGPPGWHVIETISVPCNGTVVTSQTVLQNNVPYRVRASGQCKVDEFLGNPILADAEYQGTIVPRDRDNNIDTGIAINDTTLGFNKFPHWGNYTSTHTYQISGPGQGATITLRYHDNANNAYGNNTGALTIEILSQ